MTGSRPVVLGQVAGVHGILGWLRIRSDTDPPLGILDYSPWLIGADPVPRAVRDGRRHGRGLIIQIEGCADRDQAACLVGQPIAVPRARLPAPRPDEFYWSDLEGLAVVTTAGFALGTVQRLFSTGANEVLVVRGERERLLPFSATVIVDVDFEAGRIQVDWDPDF